MAYRQDIADLLDLTSLADSSALFDQEEIRGTNPQRFEMEQVSGVVAVDHSRRYIVGYKDVVAKDFWSSGFDIGSPLSPASVEVAAQLAVFYLKRFDLFPGAEMIGIGGISNLRFFSGLKPPCRLMVAVRALDVDPPCSARMEFYAEVENQAIYSGDLLCVSLNCEGGPAKENGIATRAAQKALVRSAS